MSRYRIDFDGSHDAPQIEFFPDGDACPLIALMDSVSMDTFLFDWLYADRLLVTITDTQTGERVRWAGTCWMPASPVEVSP